MDTKEDPGEMRIKLGAELLALALKVAPPPNTHILDPKTSGVVETV